MKKTIMKLVAGLLAMAVCFGNTSMTTLAAAPDETFAFSKKAVSMNEGEYATIETTASQPLEWSAANAKIVDVNEDGVVYGKKQGSTKVTAKLGTVKKTVSVKVIRSTLRLNKGDITLYVGNDGATSFRLKGTVRGAGKNISFESSDPEIAVVDANGNVTGMSEGTALITARANNNYAYCKVNVLEKGITLNNSSLNLATKGVGSSIKLLADVVGPKKNIKWTTSDKTVATVSGGTVRGRKEGSAVITATANGVSTSCYVTVYGPETFEEQVGKKVKKTQVFTTYGLSESQVTLYAGMKKADAKQLKCSAPKKDKVRWISSDENVAQVLNNGKVIAVGEGTAYISVESDVNPEYASAKCRVDVKASTVDIAEDSVTVKTKGAKQKYTLTSTVSGKNKNISWKSSNTKVATVSRGIVTGKKEGTAVITATANGVSDTVTVNVVAYDDTMRLADEAEKPAVHVHTWSDWAVSVKAPAGGMGRESRYCTTCKMVQNRSYTAPEQEEPEKPEKPEEPEKPDCLKGLAPHTWSEWKDDAEASEKLGVKVESRTCSVCGQKETQKPGQSYTEPGCMNGLGEHTWGEWLWDSSESNARGKDTESRTCEVCGKNEYRDAENQKGDGSQATVTVYHWPCKCGADFSDIDSSAALKALGQHLTESEQSGRWTCEGMTRWTEEVMEEEWADRNHKDEGTETGKKPVIKQIIHYNCVCGYDTTDKDAFERHGIEGARKGEYHNWHEWIEEVEVWEDDDTQTGTETGDDTETGTETGDDTQTGTETGDDTETGTETGDDTQTGTETGDDTETGTETGDDTQTGTETGDDAQTGTETGDDTQTGTDTGTETGDDTETGTETGGGTGIVWQPDTGDDGDSASASAGCDASVTIPEEPETEEPAPEEPEKKPVIKTIYYRTCACGAKFSAEIIEDLEKAHMEHCLEVVKNPDGKLHNYVDWREEVEVYE